MRGCAAPRADARSRALRAAIQIRMNSRRRYSGTNSTHHSSTYPSANANDAFTGDSPVKSQSQMTVFRTAAFPSAPVTGQDAIIRAPILEAKYTAIALVPNTRNGVAQRR